MDENKQADTEKRPGEGQEPVKAKPNKKRMVKRIAIGVGVLIVVAAAIFFYARYEDLHPSTDDAYVHARLVQIIPKVSGTIERIHVEENAWVRAGTALFSIEKTDYIRAEKEAENNLAIAERNVNVAKQRIRSATAQLDGADTELAFAKDMARRYRLLYERKAGSKQDEQRFQTDYLRAKQMVAGTQPRVDEAKEMLETARSQREIAKLQLANAREQVRRTDVHAPADGYVTKLTSHVGQVVAAGEPVSGFVDTGSWWVDANFKETQIARIRPGQPATASIDMYGHTYQGTVVSVSFASGNTFSLLPSQNATGNWVKVTQRFPVRVRITDSKKFPLRVGASASVRIDTTKER